MNLTATKRFSDRWQMNANVTIQTRNDFNPAGSFVNPTSVEFAHGTNGDRRYLVRLNGSYQFNWGIMLSGNWVMNDGPLRTFIINGPGQVYGGVNANGAPTTITYNTLQFDRRGTWRFDRENLVDLGLAKTITFRGGKNRLRLNLDVFNVLNAATIQDFDSNNLSLVAGPSGFRPVDQVEDIVAPRVFRIGATIHF